MGRGAGFLQEGAWRGSGICWQPGTAALHPRLLPSVSGRALGQVLLRDCSRDLTFQRVRCRKTTVWIWAKESDDGPRQAGDVEPVGSSRWGGGGESHGGCALMALGSPGQWRKAPCSGRYPFLCENDVTGKMRTHRC